MSPRALACVLGDMDLVRPLGRAGIPVAVAAPPGDPVRFSRFARARVGLPSGEDGGARALDVLERFGASRREAPVLFYEDDWHLAMVSRHRDRLSRTMRFVVADAQLVEDLLDKERFSAIARRLDLPVPLARAARPAREPAPHGDFRLPVLLKPLPGRNDRWRSVEPRAKALTVGDSAALREVWARLAAVDTAVLVQELIPGPEERIESYHVYVDGTGTPAAEFTGRKIRTYPPALGHSTALTISDERDVLTLGRRIVERLGLSGVAKADFKRGPDGRLHLLEVNPRFSLWHHLAAVAGMNVPALVYADLTGEPRPPVRPARAGATWCLPWLDLRSVREQGGSARRWARWAAGCDAWSTIAWDDPLPFVGGKVGRALFERLRPGGG